MFQLPFILHEKKTRALIKMLRQVREQDYESLKQAQKRGRVLRYTAFFAAANQTLRLTVIHAGTSVTIYRDDVVVSVTPKFAALDYTDAQELVVKRCHLSVLCCLHPLACWLGRRLRASMFSCLLMKKVTVSQDRLGAGIQP